MVVGERRHRVWRILESSWVRPLIFLALIAVIWDVTIRIFNIPPYQIPSPLSVVGALRSEWPELLTHSVPTMTAAIEGFLLSAVFGVFAAVLIVGSKTVEDYIYPLLVFSQSVPKVAIAPLFVVWFGFGIFPKALMAFLLGFFPVVVSAVQGLKSVDPEMLNLAQTMEASRFQLLRMVSFPHAMPAIFAGLKVSVTLSVVGAVVGEFVGSNKGIGFLLQRSIGNFDLPMMFASLIVLSLMGGILFWVLEVVERFAVPWDVSQRHQMIVTA